MTYSTNNYDYDCDFNENEAQDNSKKAYRRKESYKTKRSKRTVSSQPGCGIGARRNRTWAW